MKLIVLKMFLLCFLLSLSVLADVNMRDSSFRESWTDFKNQNLLSRTYNSRSLETGIFGFGWCSEFDRRLKVENLETSLEDCSTPLRQKVKVKKQGQLGMVDLGQGRRAHFNEQGQMVQLQSPALGLAHLLYNKTGLTKIRLAHGTAYEISLDPSTHLVQRILGKNGDRVEYQYQSLNLIEVRSNRGLTWRLDYDDLHNLTKVSQKTSGGFLVQESIDYDEKHDQVIKYQKHQGCTDSMTYLAASRDQSTTLLQRECPGRSREVLKYQFHFTPNSDGTVALTGLSVISGSGTTTLRFHPRSGEQQVQTLGGLQ